MTGELNKVGELYIRRAGKMTAQGCPFNANDYPCCDLCPHFGEPRKDGDMTVLEICHGKNLRFEIFDDCRKEV